MIKLKERSVPPISIFEDSIPIYFWAALVLFSLSIYFLLPINYNIYYIDDAWVISNVWNITQFNIAKDLVFIPAGESGHAQYFGITYAKVMGSCLELLGWTKGSIFFINSIFVWSTALVWYLILGDLPCSPIVRKLMLFFIPVFPPFFFAAHSGRPEAMVLFLLSLQYFFFIKKRYFLSFTLFGPIIESHIMGGVGGFFMLGHFWFQRKAILFDKKIFGQMLVSVLFGGAVSVAYYFSFHYAHFSMTELSELVHRKRDMGSPLNNYILNYFINYDWYSRFWEFALLLFSLGVFVQRKYFKQHPYLTIMLAVLIVSTLITRRENRNYFVYIFPIFLLMYFYVFERLGKLRIFVLGLVATLGLYYSGHYYFNGSYEFQRVIDEVQVSIDDKQLPVIGVPDFWFAVKEQQFIPLHHRQQKALLTLDDFVFIEADYLAWRCKLYTKMKTYYNVFYKAEMIGEIDTGNGHQVRILKYQRRALTKIKK